MLVAGDMNSYTQPRIDHTGGSANVRANCFAATLTALGFRDTFKERRPDTCGVYTHQQSQRKQIGPDMDKIRNRNKLENYQVVNYGNGHTQQTIRR